MAPNYKLYQIYIQGGYDRQMTFMEFKQVRPDRRKK